MNISYDATVDALYIKLIPGDLKVECRNVDDDVALNFDELDRLVGIEVLDASRRLDLSYLFPVEIAQDSSRAESTSVTSNRTKERSQWEKLIPELAKRKKEGKPVETVKKHLKNWVEEVAENYVIVKRDKTGNTCKITRGEFENGTNDSLKKGRKSAITRALREIASSM